MKILIDPPNGWKYGFPKPISKKEYNQRKNTLKDWCIENGYPEKEAYSYGDLFFIRVINAPKAKEFNISNRLKSFLIFVLTIIIFCFIFKTIS
jgi:hypothetical protein